MRDTQWLSPPWGTSDVGATMTTRKGGHSAGPYADLNLGRHVGDEPALVAANRVLFAARIDAMPVFLSQVHGNRVIRLTSADARPDAAPHEADACVTTESGLACSVLVADCLPVLMAAPERRGVAAAHVGWRGLSAGVLEAALGALCEAARCDAPQVRAWLGACIGPGRFEVGIDVLHALGVAPEAADAERFAAAPSKGGQRKWLANLPLLARDRLAAHGVRQISGADLCTVEDAFRFFSFRRDGVTGRMAAAIWLRRSMARSVASTSGKSPEV